MSARRAARAAVQEAAVEAAASHHTTRPPRRGWPRICCRCKVADLTGTTRAICADCQEGLVCQ